MPPGVQALCTNASVAIQSDTLTAYPTGTTALLQAEVRGSGGGAVDAVITWMSSDPTVARVLDGVPSKLELLRPGTSTVQAAACDTATRFDVVVFSRYEVVDLRQLLAFSDSLKVYDMNDAWQITGERKINDAWTGFRWSGNTFTDLACTPTAINASGQIACIAMGPGDLLWDNGQVTDVVDDTMNTSNPVISDSAMIAGYARRVGSTGQSALFRWRAGTISFSDPLWSLLWVGRPNSLGDVPFAAGSIYNQGMVWFADGTFGPSLTCCAGRYSRANAINDSGDVVGYSERQASSGQTVAVIARKATQYREDTISTSAMSGSAVDINNSGLAVGTASSQPSNACQGFLWRAGRRAALTSLAPLVTGASGYAPIVITDAGLILASACDAQGKALYPVVIQPPGSPAPP